MDVSPLNSGLFSLPMQANNRRSEEVENSERGVVIEIQPSEGNVSDGDRSQNTAEISITTTNNQFAAEVSREQFFNGVERRLTENTLDNALGNSPTSSLPLSPEAAALSFQSSLLQTYSASTQYANNLNAIGTESSPYNASNPSGPSSQQASNAVAAYNEAVDSYINQTLFFSAIA